MSAAVPPKIAPIDLPRITGPLSPRGGRPLLPLAGLAAFLVAIWVLDRELQVLDYRSIVASLRATSGVGSTSQQVQLVR